jgi:hypothetical protein
MPVTQDQYLPVIRKGFLEAARRISEGAQKGYALVGTVQDGMITAAVKYNFGLHSDQSGDFTIFVTVAGKIIEDAKLKQALANEFGYIRTRRTFGVTKTDFYLTLNPVSIGLIAQGEL